MALADNALIGQNIKYYRHLKGMTLEQLGNELDMTPSTIQRYEAGKISKPKLVVIEGIARALGISSKQLTSPNPAFNAVNAADTPADKAVAESTDKADNSDLPSNMSHAVKKPQGDYTEVPVIGRVAAGLAHHAEENIENYISVLTEDMNSGYEYVFLRVKGDSMYPLFIENDLVLVECGSGVNNGECAVFIVDNEDGIVKRFYRYPNRIELRSENPYYPPRIFEGEEADRVRVFGRVVEVRRKLR